MQIKELFKTKDEDVQDSPKKQSVIDLNLDQFLGELSNYLKDKKDLSNKGFRYSLEKENFQLDFDIKMLISVFGGLIGLITSLFLPGRFLINMLGIGIVVGSTIYNIVSPKSGIYSKRIRHLKKKMIDLEVLLKNDQFKLSLLVNVEKYFISIEQQLDKSNNVFAIDKQYILDSLKHILVEEDMNNIKKLHDTLESIQLLTDKYEKIIKVNLLSKEVTNKLNSVVEDEVSKEKTTTEDVQLKSLL